MLFSILLMLKTILFINLTKVEHNQISVFIISSLISLLILSLIYNSRSKRKNTWALVIYSLVSLIMLIDVSYYKYFNALPSVLAAKQATQLTTVGSSLKQLLNLKLLLTVIDIPFLIYYLKRKVRRGREDILSKKVLPIVFSIILILTFVIQGFKGALDSITAQELYSYHLRDIKANLIDKNVHISEGTGVFTKEDLKDLEKRTDLPEGKFTGIGKDKNLIVLQIEALQDFVIDFKYFGQEITPNLNRLIKENSSLYYNNYYQLIGRGNTSDAEFVSHNSLYPSMEEPTYLQYTDNKYYGLPWLLKDEGYTSWAFHGYEKEFWNREKAYVSQGFERFISEEDFEFEETIGFGLKDEDFFHQSIDYLKELDSIDDNPFYAFMVSLTSHTPFEMPEDLQVLNIKEEHKNTLVGNYLESIHYTDKYIGKFIRDLKRQGLYDNSVIAIYGDHFAIASILEDEQKIMTDLLGRDYHYDEMMKIPLIVHVPGEDINETIDDLGSQLDFYPTILNIMGYKNEKGLIFGKDLNNYEGKNIIYPQTYMQKGSFIDDNIMFEISRDGIFDHSKAIDRKTRKEIDIQPFKPEYEKAINEINKSNFILKTDLLKAYIENDKEITLEEVQRLNIPNKEILEEAHYNSLEELEEKYEKGQRLLSVDLQWTRDDKIVLLKDWYWYYDNLFKGEVDHPTLEEFKSMEMVNNQTQMDIEDLIQWVEEHEDVYIVLNTTEEKDAIFVKIKDKYPELNNRFIPRIKHFQQYFSSTFRGFRNVLLDIEVQGYSDEEVLDFVNRYPHYGIIMDIERGKTSLPKKLQELGLEVYVRSPERRLDKFLLKKKATGYIVPKDQI